MIQERRYFNELSKLISLQEKYKSLSSIFANHYPVTVVHDGIFEIYDIKPNQTEYDYIQSEPCRFPLPEGVLAAFPLECYGGKPSAIISPGAFNSLEGYVFILHEFVNCAQYAECEPDLRADLVIAQEYMKKNDPMWEINHPFPYDNPLFVMFFRLYLNSFSIQDFNEIKNVREQLKKALPQTDYEYFLWQEWKEGLARYLENKIRVPLGLEENHFGCEIPFDRISFYESGSRLISCIVRNNPNAINDIRDLYMKMQTCDG